MNKHRQLTTLEREQFCSLVREARETTGAYKFLKNSNAYMRVWAYVIIASAVYFSASLSGLVRLYLGLAGMQVVFVASHIAGHGMFLEYQELDKPARWRHQSIVFYYAFYHHHHAEKDNWAPDMSTYTSNGIRAITAAHWESYSILLRLLDQGLASMAGLALIIVAVHDFPAILPYFLGYELGVLLLPFAHGWQHGGVSERLPSWLRALLTGLVRLGVIAGRKEHRNHHNHRDPTVYQDFMTSGFKVIPFYGACNRWLNRRWDAAFRRAEKEGVLIYDLLKPWVYAVYAFVLLLAPGVLLLAA